MYKTGHKNKIIGPGVRNVGLQASMVASDQPSQFGFESGGFCGVHALCFRSLVQGSSSFLGMSFRLNSKESDASV